MNIFLALAALWHALFFVPSPQMNQAILAGNSTSGAPATPTYITSNIAQSTDNTSITAGATVNSTGGDYILLQECNFNAAAVTPTDSKSNTWDQILTYNGNTMYLSWYECHRPCTVGSGHTFSISGGSFPSLIPVVFSGINSGTALDGTPTTANGNVVLLQAGAFTPAGSGEMFIASLSGLFPSTSTPTLTGGSGFTLVQSAGYNGSGGMGCSFAYKLGSSSSENPEWNNGSGGNTNMTAGLGALKHP